MKLLKVSLDNADVLRKRKIHTSNFYISSEIEHFTCGTATRYIYNKHVRGSEFKVGIGKREDKVSIKAMVSPRSGMVDGGW